MRVLWALLVVVVRLACPAEARAQDTPRVTTELDPCVPVDAVQFERLLAIELGTSQAQATDTPSATHVAVGCASRGIELRLEDAVTRKSMARVLPADSFRDASSTRLLALAVAEFVVASWIELTVQPEPVVEPAGPAPTPEVERAAKRVSSARQEGAAPRSGSLSLLASAQLWSGHGGAMLGAGVRFLQRPVPDLALLLGGDFGLSHVDTFAGEISISTGSAMVGMALPLRLDHFEFYTGPGGRIGFARMVGKPSDPTVDLGLRFFAPWGGPLWFARVQAELTGALLVVLDLEAGIVTLPLDALSGEQVLVALDGGWFTVGLGLGVAF